MKFSKRKIKPLFDAINIQNSDFFVERKKKIARMELQKAFDDFEKGLGSCDDIGAVTENLDILRRKFGKLLKKV